MVGFNENSKNGVSLSIDTTSDLEKSCKTC
jgi:hypothetical protein